MKFAKKAILALAGLMFLTNCGLVAEKYAYKPANDSVKPATISYSTLEGSWPVTVDYINKKRLWPLPPSPTPEIKENKILLTPGLTTIDFEQYNNRKDFTLTFTALPEENYRASIRKAKLVILDSKEKIIAETPYEFDGYQPSNYQRIPIKISY